MLSKLFEFSRQRDDCFFEIFGLLALLMNRHQKTVLGYVIEMYLASNANINNVISQVQVKSNQMFQKILFLLTRSIFLYHVFQNNFNSSSLMHQDQKFKKMHRHPGKIIQLTLITFNDKQNIMHVVRHY